MTIKTNTTAIESIDQLSVGSKLVLNGEGRGFFNFMNLLTEGNDPITNTLEDVGYLEVTGFNVDEQGDECVALRVTKCIDTMIERLQEIGSFEIVYQQILEHFELLEEEVVEVETFKAGDKVRSLIEDVDYPKGEVFSVGTDAWGDFGVIDKDGYVYIGGYLDEEDTEKTMANFELVEVRKAEAEEGVYVFQVGDIVRCLKGGGLWYKEGGIYEVGYDSYGDLGVLDWDGDVTEYGMLVNNSGMSPSEEWSLEQTLKNFKLIK